MIRHAEQTKVSPAQRPVVTHQQFEQRFQAALQEMPLFARSGWESLCAQIVPLLTGWAAGANKHNESTVVDQLTLWERFLVHRSRVQRPMTFAVALRNKFVNPQTYIFRALTTILTQVIDSQGIWENQPLDVEVGRSRRLELLDPRNSILDNFGVAIVDAQNRIRYCSIDLGLMKSLSSAARIEAVTEQLALASPQPRCVSVVLDETPQHANRFVGTYSELPGAWLRVAPDAATGGLIMTADHLVLDGGLFQDLLLRTVLSCSSVGNALVTNQSNPETKGVSHARHVSFLRAESLCTTLRQVVSSLESMGIALSQGRENLLLATIPNASDEGATSVVHRCRRILPQLLSLEDLGSCDDLRLRIRKLRTRGTQALGEILWERLYSGQMPHWVIQYFEHFALRIPFQRTARYLTGSALLSCLPPATAPGICASEIAHLSARTVNPPGGGPTVTLMQVPHQATGEYQAYLTLSGSDAWNCPGRLGKLGHAIVEQRKQRASLRSA
ncbi:MAG: hypothetical protein R3C18_14335 [Planctomycetaceae bacterium]